MEHRKKKRIFHIYSPWKWVCLALGTGILAMLVVSACLNKGEPVQEEPPAPRRSVVIDKADWESARQEGSARISVSAQTVEDGLRDMGVLVTQEYYFTEVIEYSKTDKFLWLFNSTSSTMLSYEGRIGAGVDFGKIGIQIDPGTDTVTVTVPPASIQYTELDQDSLVVYSEKNSLGNKLGIKEFNDAQNDLKTAATEKALQRGLLDKAAENAQNLIRNFIIGMVGPDIHISFEKTA